MTAMTTPVENGFLFSYPKITRVDRRSDVVEIELLNDEGLQ